MLAAEGTIGRVFMLRLQDGDRIPDSIEQFAAEKNIEAAYCALLGGAGKGKLVVGPLDEEAEKIEPIVRVLSGVHEAAAIGTLFKNAQGEPKLHMHAVLGNNNETLCGCVRQGVEVWKIAEVLILELAGLGLSRKYDPAFMLELLSK